MLRVDHDCSVYCHGVDEILYDLYRSATYECKCTLLAARCGVADLVPAPYRHPILLNVDDRFQHGLCSAVGYQFDRGGFGNLVVVCGFHWGSGPVVALVGLGHRRIFMVCDGLWIIRITSSHPVGLYD